MDNLEEICRFVQKASAIFRTRIPSVERREIAKKIWHSKLNEKLDEDGYGLVDELRYVKTTRTKNGIIDHFSFATKFLFILKPNKFPIFDSLNMKAFYQLFGCKYTRNYDGYEIREAPLKFNPGKYYYAVPLTSPLIFFTVSTLLLRDCQ